MNLDTSIVVVTYNCEAFIKRFLTELIISLTNVSSYEILIFDNASKDDTFNIASEWSSDKIHVFSNNKNVGFSKANNILINKAIHNNILLLNPDVFGFEEAFWEKTFTYWDYKNPMFIKLLNQDGSFQDCVGDICGPERMLKRFNKVNKYADIIEPVEVGMGIMAFMLAPKLIFDKVGLLAEDYHMYSEDMDWCYRAAQKGYKNVFEPRVQLTHVGGASAKTTGSEKTTSLIKYDSQKKFIKTHFKGIKRFLSLLSTNFMIIKTYLS